MCKLRDDTMSQAGELPMETKMEDEGMFRPLKNLSAAEVAPQTRAAIRGEAVLDMNFLCSTMDAQVWATEFCKLNKASDHGMMLGWFANAIMAGFDEANRRSPALLMRPPSRAKVPRYGRCAKSAN